MCLSSLVKEGKSQTVPSENENFMWWSSPESIGLAVTGYSKGSWTSHGQLKRNLADAGAAGASKRKASYGLRRDDWCWREALASDLIGQET